MGDVRPKYPLAFRRAAVAEVLKEHRAKADVARELGISVRNLRRWVGAAEQLNEAEPDTAVLQRRIQQLERENQALQEANRFFAQRRSKQQRTTS